MLEIVLTSSESDQYLSAPKEISNFPLIYMTGYFCRSVYIYFILCSEINAYQKQIKMIPITSEMI